MNSVKWLATRFSLKSNRHDRSLQPSAFARLSSHLFPRPLVVRFLWSIPPESPPSERKPRLSVGPGCKFQRLNSPRFEHDRSALLFEAKETGWFTGLNMARISQPKVRRFLSRAQKAATTRAKGTIFEDLICYIIEKLPGVSVTKRGILNPYHSEEIDIAIWNEQLPTGLRAVHHVILIEAKHWAVPAGAPEVNHFVAKLRARSFPLEFS